MYARRDVRAGLILRFSRRSLFGFAALGAVACVMYDGMGWRFVALPFVPIGVIGTAVAFAVGFKNNSSYERLWEARRVWGALTNVCRTWAVGVLDLVAAGDGDDGVRRELVLRQVAYVHALRSQLRRPAPWEGEMVADRRVVAEVPELRDPDPITDLARLLGPDEAKAALARPNPAAALMRTQSARLAELRAAGRLDGWAHTFLMGLVEECYTQQGAAERIKGFPFPRQYAYFSGLFVSLFLALLPFGLLGEFARLGGGLIWLTVPFATLIGWVFVTMEAVGDSSEDPFKGGLNDVPVTAICRNIEIDLRDLLGEADLPPRLAPVHDVLM